MKQLITNFILLFGFPLVLPAQQYDSTDSTWTLHDCIHYAHENNIMIKREELNTFLAESDYRQSKYDLLPELGAAINHEFSSGRSLNRESYEWENRNKQQGAIGLQNKMTLFNGFENLNKIKRDKYLFLKSVEDLEKAKNDISLRIVTYYLQVLFDQELLDVALRKYEVTMLQVEKTKRLAGVGNVARGELLEIRAQAASDKVKVTGARNNLNLSVLDLAQLLDLESVENFSVHVPADLTIEGLGIPASFGEIYQKALAAMPEILSAQYRVLSSEKQLSIVKGRCYPELYLNALYYSRYVKDLKSPLDTIPPIARYSHLEQIDDNQYRQITIGLSIPIFNKFATRSAITKSKINLQDAKYYLKQREQQLYKEIQQAHSDAIASLERYKFALEAVAFNEEAFECMRQKFEAGLANSIDFNIAQSNLTKARSDLIQARYEYIFKMKILDFYGGRSIEL